MNVDMMAMQFALEILRGRFTVPKGWQLIQARADEYGLSVADYVAAAAYEQAEAMQRRSDQHHGRKTL